MHFRKVRVLKKLNGKIYRTKKRPDENFHQGVSIKINIIMKKIIFLYF